MIENIYAALQKVGFTHPLHPVLVHVPMGMIIGMFVFSLLGLKWKKGYLQQTAYHCSVLALAEDLVTGRQMLPVGMVLPMNIAEGVTTTKAAR